VIATSLQGWLVDMPWMADAVCAGEPLETFFPGQRSFDAARAICAVCPVLEDCRRTCDRAEGPPVGQLFGLYAGESPGERAARRRAAARG